MAREAEPSRILIFGGTGYIGKHIARASVAFGHPTCIYARPAGPRTKPLNLDLRREFRSTGIRIIERFVPSDFGCEEDKITPLPPFEEFLEKKRKIRRATEAAGIPFTFVATNCLAAYFINVLLHPHSPHDEIVVYGDGEANAVLNYEEDVGKYTIKVANDPRACNRVVSYRPKPSIISQHQLISLWEEKTGRSFKRVYVPEEDLVKLSQTLPPPENIPVSILHSIFVKGDLMSYEIDDDDLEVSRMYPEMQLTTIDQLLNIFLTDPPEPARAAFG
ncbi:eugenol synthase 1 isoform X2 [Eucalyptus grandis]|uniref:eugenol synthase 1 isoform X2 n=1 Tax=Eucalyptus grandis TaxID=71139 RepID=UPI00192EBE31|nr:eugenol synthase 1 isoform X2 [Eucalyptus grandis]